MNLPLIFTVILLALALVLFIIMRNRKDAIGVEETIKNDYKHPRNEEGDTIIDDLTNKVH